MPQATQAILLAGGAGTRMPALPSPNIPKPFLPIANRPMIFYSLYSLHRHKFTNISILIDSTHASLFQSYVLTEYPADPFVQALEVPLPKFDLVPRPADSGTADALRNIDFSAPDVLIMSSDYIGEVDLPNVLDRHRDNMASCTVVFVEGKKPEQEIGDSSTKQKGKKQPTKKSKSGSGGDGAMKVESYALLSDVRLLGLYSRADISGGQLPVRAPLARRYAMMQLRSDLMDPHIYVFDSAVVAEVLKSFKTISSVKFELVPYLARRQHTLSRLAIDGGWTCPGDQVGVFGSVIGGDTYSRRASTADGYLNVNLEVIGGCLDRYFGVAESEGSAKKKGKKGKDAGKKPVFKEVGERVNVSADSLVGKDVVAGDRASVKKSVVGNCVVIGKGVKLNGCVVMDDVKLSEGANLAGCVLGKGAVVGKGCGLKDCRVAAGVVVDDGLEASGRDFTGGKIGEEEEDQGFEFC